jgi:hypothetical protein
MRRITVRSFLILLAVGTLGFLAACGGGGTPVGVPTPPPPGQNTQAITIDGGPLGGYANGAFTSVQVCQPGTSTCQTIDYVLVDTGSFGLRVLASQCTITLPVLSDSNGNTLNNCVNFLDGSILWGNVAQADVKLAGEVASATSIQLIANPAPGTYSIPVACTGQNEDTQQTLGTNGILGVGPEPFDCGFNCDPGNTSGTQPDYFLCSTLTGCVLTTVSCGALCNDTQPNSQVTNPVFNFTADNNGVIVELPAVTSTAATLSGTLIFGIGTQSNNALPSNAAVLQLDSSDSFTTLFSGQTLTGSFIDSGSNGYFFPNGIESGFPGSTIPTCAPPNDSFFCPAALTSFPATNESGSTSSPINFSVDNATNLFTQDPNNFVFTDLAGPLGPGGPCNAGNPTSCSFDWGLPFFYGRNVFTAIDGAVAINGATPPFVAY